jgi:hypothetical protein
MEEIRVKIESTNSKTLDAMRKTHGNQLKVILDEKENLRANYEKKCRDVTEILNKYEQVVAAYASGVPFSSEMNAIRAIF